MRKSILTVLVFTCIGIFSSMSQNNKGRFILGFGYSFGADYTTAPYSKAMLDYGINNSAALNNAPLARDYSVSLASFYFQMNTLLKEVNSNTSNRSGSYSRGRVLPA